EGKPKTPLPMMQFTVSAARLQRPIARTSPSLEVASVALLVIASLYHRCRNEGSRGECRIEFHRFPMTKERRSIFIAGGTGYMGHRLIPRVMERGHEVRALVRPGSEKKLPQGCTPVTGDALDASSYAARISPADTFVQLVGVAHPSPAKSAEFRKIDLPAGLGSISAAKPAGIRHFVYVSVAHPAPMMHAYIA